MTDVLRRLIRWLFHGSPEPAPHVDLGHQDDLLMRGEYEVRRLSDPVTGIIRGERRPVYRRRVRARTGTGVRT